MKSKKIQAGFAQICLKKKKVRPEMWKYDRNVNTFTQNYTLLHPGKFASPEKILGEDLKEFGLELSSFMLQILNITTPRVSSPYLISLFTHFYGVLRWFFVGG